MPTISFEGNHYPSQSGETILETLLRNGALLPSKCKTGACRTCMVRVIAGTPPAAGQAGLKDTMAAQGHILPCSCQPEGDITLGHINMADHEVTLTVSDITPLGTGEVRIRFTCNEPLSYRPGQYINLVRPSDELVRSFCLASAPDEDGFLEIHVARTADGKMSRWLCDELQIGATVGCYGPAGDCFYLPGKHDSPLLMVAIGSGLAGIYGILRDALKHGHTGHAIHLIHAAEPTRHYLSESLSSLAAQHPNLTITECGPDKDDLTQSIKAIAADGTDLSGWRAYACGDPAKVKAVQKTAFLNGIAMADIYTVMFEN